MNSNLKSTTQPLSSQTELTLEDALAELERLKQERLVRPQGAKTAQEWADVWQVGLTKARKILRGLIEVDRMECLQLPMIDMAGRTNHTFVYRTVTNG